MAVELARAGEVSGEVMRFMRKTLGLRAADLAGLLDVTPETVSRWETSKQPLEHRAMAVLGSLVVERFEGRSAVLDTLNALRWPRKLGRRVQISLSEAAAGRRSTPPNSTRASSPATGGRPVSSSASPRKTSGSSTGLQNDPRFLARVEKARASIRAGRGVRLEELD